MKYVNTNVSLPCCFRQNANNSTNIFRLTIMIFDQYETNSQQGFPAWFPALNYIATAFTFLYKPAHLCLLFALVSLSILKH